MQTMLYSSGLDEALLAEPGSANDFKMVETLYISYNRVAFSLAFKMLQDYQAAEDAVQEAFLKFWRKPDSFNPARGRFINWILTVVRNICLDYLRETSQYGTSLDYLLDAEQPQPDRAKCSLVVATNAQNTVEEEVWLNLKREIIRAALAQLAPGQLELINIAFFKGLSHQQIANQTGLALGTVKSRIRRGLLELKANQHLLAYFGA